MDNLLKNIDKMKWAKKEIEKLSPFKFMKLFAVGEIRKLEREVDILQAIAALDEYVLLTEIKNDKDLAKISLIFDGIPEDELPIPQVLEELGKRTREEQKGTYTSYGYLMNKKGAM